MQLLDRYLTAVKFWLPKTQRDDIAAELSTNLQAEIDDRAAELGRPLTDDEIAALLKQHGSPILVASRYQQEHRTVSFGRQLIGPVVFPFYWVGLKVTFVLLLVSAIIPALVLSANINPAREVGHILFRVLHLALPALFFVTLIFAVFDFGLRKFHFVEKWANDWDPRKLPPSDRQAKQVPRSSSIAGIIIQSIFIVWWWNHGSIPYLAVTNAGAQVHFAPILATLHLPILIISFIYLAQYWINLVEPNWRWLPPAIGFLTTLAALLIIYPLLYTSPLISIFDPHGVPISAREAAQINKLIFLGTISLWLTMLIVATIYAWRLVWVVWQMVPRSGTASSSNGIAHT